jgi:hypothetical protein
MLRRRGLLSSVLAANLSVVPLLTAAPMRSATTPEEWMGRALKLYEHKFGNTSLLRRVSYSPGDWPRNSGTLVRLSQFDAPLLEEPSFIKPNLRITGIGREGEVFQLLETRELLFLSNPLSNDWKAPNGNGIWAKIRGIDGTEGWIFAGARTAPATYISRIQENNNTNSPSLFSLILGALFNLALLAGIITLLYRWLKPSRRKVQTSPVSSTSTSYDYSSYSGSGRQRIVDEEMDEEETNQSRGSSRRQGGLIDKVDDAYEQLFPKSKRRKCPDCDGEEIFDPETGNGVCSECHGSGLEPDPLEAFTKALSGTRQNCPTCGGDKTCQTCGGKGYIKD